MLAPYKSSYRGLTIWAIGALAPISGDHSSTVRHTGWPLERRSKRNAADPPGCARCPYADCCGSMLGRMASGTRAQKLAKQLRKNTGVSHAKVLDLIRQVPRISDLPDELCETDDAERALSILRQAIGTGTPST